LLGLIIDNRLTFNANISHICQKASRQVNVLARLSNILDTKCKMLLYNSFVECYFNYCSTLWHFCSNSDTTKIEKVQKRALRYVISNFESNYVDLLQTCSKSPLYVVRLRKIVELVYRINNGKSPSYLNVLFSKNATKRILRSKNDMSLPKFKTITYGKQSLKYTAALLWNDLANDVKDSDSLHSFKHKVKLWAGPNCKCGFCIACKVTHC